MPTEMTYSNIEVYKRSLEQVVRKEPEWAASRIRECERLESDVIPAMQSELDLLRARIGGFQHVDDLRQAMVDTADENKRLRTALAKAERDAERYRWIRYWNRVDPLRLPEDVSFEHEDDFDAAIDAAMAREEG